MADKALNLEKILSLFSKYFLRIDYWINVYLMWLLCFYHATKWLSLLHIYISIIKATTSKKGHWCPELRPGERVDPQSPLDVWIPYFVGFT